MRIVGLFEVTGAAACACAFSVSTLANIIQTTAAHELIEMREVDPKPEEKLHQERHMSIAEPVLKAEKITKQVSSPEGTLTILAEVDVGIAAGETVAIIGASGAGKSTLLALLAGLDEPSTVNPRTEGAFRDADPAGGIGCAKVGRWFFGHMHR